MRKHSCFNWHPLFFYQVVMSRILALPHRGLSVTQARWEKRACCGQHKAGGGAADWKKAKLWQWAQQRGTWVAERWGGKGQSGESGTRQWSVMSCLLKTSAWTSAPFEKLQKAGCSQSIYCKYRISLKLTCSRVHILVWNSEDGLSMTWWNDDEIHHVTPYNINASWTPMASKKSFFPYLYWGSVVNGPLEQAWQHHKCTCIHTSIAAHLCFVIYVCRTKVIQHQRKEVQRERSRKKKEDWQTHRLLYWTGVPLPWQPAALDWYLEQWFELLQRISCSVRIWGQLIWSYSQVPAMPSPHRARSPLFGTRWLSPDPLAWKTLIQGQITPQLSSSWRMIVLPCRMSDLKV